MNPRRALALACCACLWLALAGCGNKGPLVPPGDQTQDQRDKARAGRNG